MKRVFVVLIWLLLSAATASTWAQSSLRVGVLAFRPKAQATEQWQPLASYLATALDRTVVLTTYDLP